MIEAAKEEIFLSFPAWCVDSAPAALMVNAEKPHQGVVAQKCALHQGIAWSNSTTPLGLRGLGLENGVRSRCTGKERDSESGLDMFGARYYGSSLGRFMTPDWAAKPTSVPYANFGNPQSLNLYSYVENNPTTTGDPDGHCPPCALVLEGLVEEGAIAAWNYVAGATVLGTTAAAAGGNGNGVSSLYYQAKFANATNSNTTPAPSTTPAPGATTEQGRDAEGKFLPKQPGQTAPGKEAEQGALEAEGATRTGTALPGTNRRVDGTVTETGQKIEVKSGESVSNTGQLVATGQAAQAATGQPLLVVTTNPNVKVSAPAQANPNLQIRPVKKPDQQ